METEKEIVFAIIVNADKFHSFEISSIVEVQRKIGENSFVCHNGDYSQALYQYHFEILK